MKKIFTLSFLLILQLNSNAQSYLWANTCSLSTYSHLIALKQDHAGDLYFGTYDDSTGHILKTRLEKRTQSQNVLWSITLLSGAEITDVEINSLNHAIVTGVYKDTLVIGGNTLISNSYTSAFIFEADENGTITWAVSFNPAGDEFRPVDLFVNRNDEIYLTAQIAGTHGSCSFHKLDVWGGPVQDEFNDNFEDRSFSHILVDIAGNVYISGTCGNGATFDSLISDPTASYQNMLIKYDAGFNAQWIITRPYITFDDNNGLGSDGNSLYWSFIEAKPNADTIRMIKADYSGNIQLDVPGPLQGVFFPSVSMSTDSSGNNVLISNIYSRLFLFRYDNQFNLLWEDTILAHTQGFPSEVQIVCYDSVFYTGSRYFGDSLYVDSTLLINPNGSVYYADVFVAKWGYQDPLSVSSYVENNFFSAYPNPANGNVTIYYDKDISATLTILDYSGKLILEKPISSSGKYTIDLSSIASGLYILNLKIVGSSTDLHSKLVIQH